MALGSRSIFEYLGGDGGHKCGYCGKEDGFIAPGLWAHRMSVQDLQDLTDRGWRRSGKYCYKPDNSEMCCPLFIIRCDAPNFKLSKSHKKALKKFHAFLKPPTPKVEKSSGIKQEGAEQVALPDKSQPQEKGVPKKGVGPDPSKPPCRKAKEIRKERKMLKEQARETPTTSSSDKVDKATVGGATVLPSDTPKSLEEYMQFPTPEEKPQYKLEIRLVRSFPPSPEFKRSLSESYEVYKKYQMLIHKDPPDKLTMKQYTRFLVDSPLIPESGPPEWEIGYGSYHQQYYLNDRLIMVGVVDVLPNCLSSKYLYYDPEFSFLSMGVVSALNEIKLVRRLHSFNPSFQYYCMGYYNHTCPKMNYKGHYGPAYLLCSETNTYIPIERCLPKLDTVKYTKLADEQEPNDSVKNPVDSFMGKTLVLLGGANVMPYELFTVVNNGKEIPQMREYCSLVGQTVGERAIVAFQ